MKKVFFIIPVCAIILLFSSFSSAAPVAPSLDASTGLFRVHSAYVLPRMAFGVALHGDVFYSPWLVDPDLGETRPTYEAGAAPSNPKYLQIGGRLSFSIAPLDWLETGFTTWGASASVREGTREDFLQSIGDFSVFAKAVYVTQEGMNIGGEIEIMMPTRIENFMWDADSTTVTLRGLWSLDLDSYIAAPFRLHLNVGYIIDNTSNLPENRDVSRAVKYFYGVHDHGMILGGIALEFPTDDITAFIEYTTYQMVSRSWNDNSQLLTPGIRITPLQGLSIDLGADISMSAASAGIEVQSVKVVNEPLWNVNFGVSYVFLPPAPLKVEKVEAPPPPKTGRIKGKVVDAATGDPIGDAIIEFPGTGLSNIASDPLNGTFLSWELAAGENELIVRKEGYAVKKVTVLVKAGTTVEETIELEKEEMIGLVVGKVTDPNNVPIPAIIGIKNRPDLPGTPVEPSTGTFEMRLPPGRYTVVATAEGFIESEKVIEVRNRARTIVEFVLQPIPKPIKKKPAPPPPPPPKRRPPIVELKREKGVIEIKKKILFELGKSRLLPASFPILDEVAKILIDNPDLKVRIEGHTDSTGSRAYNLRLSQKRAEAVREYLIKKGISPDRLVAVGYGPDRPIAPNNTPEGRARNRRVEFHIIK